MDAVMAIAWIAVVGIGVAPVVVCAVKGKWGFVFLSVLLWPIIPLVGAIRLAKPSSRWAKRYDAEKLRKARDRFPYDTVAPCSNTASSSRTPL